MLSPEYRQKGRGNYKPVSRCVIRHPRLHTISNPTSLLGVYSMLKAVGASTNDEEEQLGHIDKAKAFITDICRDHISAAQTYVGDAVLLHKLIARIEVECQELIEYIIATKRFKLEINARSKDRVVSFGEKLACLSMTAVLQDGVCKRSTMVGFSIF